MRLSKQYTKNIIRNTSYTPATTLQSWIHHLAGVQTPWFAIMMCCMRHKQPVSALWGWMKEGGRVGWGVRVASKGDDWPVHSGERRCHRLPYLKEMRRAEEGGTGRERKRVKTERKKGNVIFQGDCPTSLPVL